MVEWVAAVDAETQPDEDYVGLRVHSFSATKTSSPSRSHWQLQSDYRSTDVTDTSDMACPIWSVPNTVLFPSDHDVSLNWLLVQEGGEKGVGHEWDNGYNIVMDNGACGH